MRTNYKCVLPDGTTVVVESTRDAKQWLTENQTLLLSQMIPTYQWSGLFTPTLEPATWIVERPVVYDPSWTHVPDEGDPVVVSSQTEARLWTEANRPDRFWRTIFEPSREAVTWSSSDP